MAQLSTTHHRYSLAAAFLFLFVFPTTVAAIPIEQYQQNLTRAIATLETLNEFVDDESYEFEHRRADSVEAVRTSLPKQQAVEFEGDVCNVDNSWLHKALDELEKTADPSDNLAQILWSLRALESRVAERQNPGEGTAEKKEWAKTRLESILARPEYATK